MRSFLNFSGPPARVQKSSAAELFLGFGLETNSATNSLQMISFYLNPTSPINVKASGQKVIQLSNKQPLFIQQFLVCLGFGAPPPLPRMHDCIHIYLIPLDFRLSQENQYSQTPLPQHLGVAKSLQRLLCSCLSLPSDSQHKANSVLLSHPLRNTSCFWAVHIPQGIELLVSPTTEVPVGKSGISYPTGCSHSLEKSLFAIKIQRHKKRPFYILLSASCSPVAKSWWQQQ